jgi:hypothetical protein
MTKNRKVNLTENRLGKEAILVCQVRGGQLKIKQVAEIKGLSSKKNKKLHRKSIPTSTV